MRVLILVEACGGVARHVTDLCVGLHRRGIEVCLIYSPQRADAVLAAGLERLTALPIPVAAVAMGPAPRPADLGSWCEIRRHLRRWGPFDILHGHSSKGGALARLFPAGCRRASVYTPHAFVTMNPALGGLRSWFYRALERGLAGLGDAVIATSPAEYEHARTELRIPPARLFLVPNGIEPPRGDRQGARDELRRLWGVRPDDTVIGAVGRFVPQKAPEHLLRAFAGAGLGGGCRLVMVGEGPLQPALEAAAIRLGIADRVVWAGQIPASAAMAAFDVFALGSRYEGFAYVLLDALAAGLPIVATAVGGVDLAVAPGENGFAAPVDDVHAMAAALARLGVDGDLRARMGASSLARSAQFSLDAMVDGTVAVYRKVLGVPLH